MRIKFKRTAPTATALPAPAPLPPRAPLPSSTWGPDTARIHAAEDAYLAYLAAHPE